MESKFIRIPILDQAAAEIKQSDSFEQTLKKPEVETIMTTVINGALRRKKEKVTANVTSMNVDIENNQGHVQATAAVEKPITGDIGINLTLENTSRPGQLGTKNLEITAPAIAKGKIQKAAEDALKNPNQALFTELYEQLQLRGVSLTGISLNFKDNALSINLQGNEI